MDAMVRMAGEGERVLVGVVWVMLLVGIVPLLALAVAALASEVVHRAQRADTPRRGGRPRESRPPAATASGRRGPRDASREWVVLAAPEQVSNSEPAPESTGPPSVGGRPPAIGLLSAEVLADGTPRERPSAQEAPVAPERLAFARWLVEPGRLSG